MRYRLSAPTHGPNGGVVDTLDEAKVVSLGMGCAGPKREYWLGRLLWARLGAGLASKSKANLSRVGRTLL